MRKYYLKVGAGFFGTGFISIKYKTKIFGFIPWSDEIHRLMFNEFEDESPQLAIRKAKKMVKELNEFEEIMREVPE